MKTITENAFLARVRRRLARDGERLVISRREALHPNDDRYAAVDGCGRVSGGWDSIGAMLRLWAIPAGLLRPGEAVEGWEDCAAPKIYKVVLKETTIRVPVHYTIVREKSEPVPVHYTIVRVPA